MEDLEASIPFLPPPFASRVKNNFYFCPLLNEQTSTREVQKHSSSLPITFVTAPTNRIWALAYPWVWTSCCIHLLHASCSLRATQLPRTMSYLAYSWFIGCKSQKKKRQLDSAPQALQKLVVNVLLSWDNSAPASWHSYSLPLYPWLAILALTQIQQMHISSCFLAASWVAAPMTVIQQEGVAGSWLFWGLSGMWLSCEPGCSLAYQSHAESKE